MLKVEGVKLVERGENVLWSGCWEYPQSGNNSPLCLRKLTHRRMGDALLRLH